MQDEGKFYIPANLIEPLWNPKINLQDDKFGIRKIEMGIDTHARKTHACYYYVINVLRGRFYITGAQKTFA